MKFVNGLVVNEANFCIHLPTYAYNDSYRILHNLPRWTSARLSQIECHIITFEAILLKTTFSFIQRCQSSSNNLIHSLMTSGCFYESNF